MTPRDGTISLPQITILHTKYSRFGSCGFMKDIFFIFLIYKPNGSQGHCVHDLYIGPLFISTLTETRFVLRFQRGMFYNLIAVKFSIYTLH